MSFSFDLNWEPVEEFLDSAEEAQAVGMFTVPYAIYVEMPTQHNKRPPLDPLKEWVRRNINTDDVEGVAYAIQTKIYKEGTDGVFFVSDMIDDYRGGRAQQILENYEEEDDPSAPEDIIEDLIEDMVADAQGNLSQDEGIDTGRLHDSATYVMGKDIDDVDEINIQEVTR